MSKIYSGVIISSRWHCIGYARPTMFRFECRYLVTHHVTEVDFASAVQSILYFVITCDYQLNCFVVKAIWAEGLPLAKLLVVDDDYRFCILLHFYNMFIC